MRYVAFSVALAATVFGTALRVRPLAWATVSLTAVTLALSVAYFVPRPAGLALFSANRTPDRTARWFVQAESGNGDLDAFRFLADRVSSSGDDRARRRTQHLPLPCLGRRVATHRSVRPRRRPGSRGCRVARGRPVEADERGSPRGEAGGVSSSRPRAAGGSSAVPDAAARHARLRSTERVPTRPAAPKTMRAGTTGIANSMIV